MNDTLPPAPPRRPARWLLPLAGVVVLAAAGYAGWHYWQQAQHDRQAQAQTTAVQLKGLEATVEALRRDQRATSQRLQDAAATNRVLRDEMLGLSQRSALLEENLTKLTESANQGRQAVQRDEAELLLTQAAQRLAFADDVDGARRLYAQAATALADLPDNEGLNLRQALVQERDALDTLGHGPRVQALQRLDAVAQALQGLPSELPPSPAEAAARPWWQSALAPFVDITPSRLNGPLTQAERGAADDALQVELTLARAAIERGDRSGRDAALARVAQWAQRRWPDSPGLRAQHAELQALRQLPLQAENSVLGSTLQQLRSQTDRR
ncbi:TPA: uroporphyrinogen-III C-methyltransferase [Stenotrophomonas maltophilia]|uniref:uroporphyrinogen-III C-methyltransferase n=1 Tax=Stenotrophomonas maltophilia TaxID=40324 RepID=UPI0031B98FB2|nr:uroporphyrinogen-III C-methyltransferase [Stenotrophomonas maltophilia]HDS1024861.1 uroporphyrinogen-III C-methyltransferase [Stenotrophomonas maltophilia]HDS1028905.1 uroporphyrinogen-III C-methyltransferase [Stenotrophomonas maltophilia]HDS1033027.1 uroporphyrinogen-III C-methyltransferase [Stenotrophomonas maltophilia]HDS1038932.1 uroporphyrinogen-III C-methyltransferase [Stenotrophomonas maltophilia]